MNKEPHTMQVADAATASRAPENTPAMVKKIGKTTYKVHVHFSNTSTETMSDKSVCSKMKFSRCDRLINEAALC